MNLRKNESISVDPLGALWVVLQDLVEEDVSDRCHAPEVKSVSGFVTTFHAHLHRGTRMTRIRLEGSIDLKLQLSVAASEGEIEDWRVLNGEMSKIFGHDGGVEIGGGRGE